LVVVRVQQLKNVVAAVIRKPVVGFGVHRNAAFLDPFEMHPASADHDAEGIGAVCYLQVGEVEERGLAGIGPEIYSFGVRCAALRDRNAGAAIGGRCNTVCASPDKDRIARDRTSLPFCRVAKGWALVPAAASLPLGST
jgi:hypothetical protein